MLPLPTIRQLQYLTALADEGSFSAAAERCAVTQSTLSAGIKELETLLAQTLVDRSRKAATLTPFGQEVLDAARPLIAAAEGIAVRARALRAPFSGPLRLGVIPTIAPYLLPRLLPVIRENFPALELQLHEDLSERIVAKVMQGALDLILLALPYDAPGLAHETLFTEGFSVAAPKGRFKTKTVGEADLAQENLLLLEDGHCLRDHALAACRLSSAATRRTFSATSLATLIQMVASGYGVTLLPDMAASAGALPGAIALWPLRGIGPGREIALAWRNGTARAEEYRTLATTLRESLKG